MEFKQLRTFVEVVRTGSFTDAAQNLFLSQPTVSQHIRQLEEELGTRLVMRTTRRIEITPQGRKLSTFAEDILALRDRMLESCSSLGHSILTISASTIPSAYILENQEGLFVKYAEEIKKVVNVPVMTGGGVETPEGAEEILASGKVDMLFMGRQWIAEPNWIRKLEEGHRQGCPCRRGSWARTGCRPARQVRRVR